MSYLRLTNNQDTMANGRDYIDLGPFYADICKVLEKGTGGRSLNDLSKSARNAIHQLTT